MQSPNAIPLTVQATPALGVAVKDTKAPAGIASAAGLTAKVCAATTLTVAVPVFEPDVAVIVTLPGAVGAVKSPVPSIVPPLADQVTEVLTPPINAEKFAVWLTGTVEVPGITVISFTVGLVPPPSLLQPDNVIIPKNAMVSTATK